MSEATRLDGWKAIADHLGRDPRTVQRWHHQRGMPVHHVPGNRHGTVFAYPEELDDWLTKGAPAKEPPDPPEPRQPKDDGPAAPALQGFDARKTRRWRHLGPVPAAVLLAAGVIAIALSTFGSPRRGAVPTQWELNGPVLSALGASRDVIWNFELPEGRVMAASGVEASLDRTLSVDLNSDGLSEVVAAIGYNRAGRIEQDAELYCLTSNGRLLWRYRPNQSLIFAGQEFTRPWRFNGAAAIALPGRSVWVSFIHRTWWPSFVVRLAADGTETLAFVNAGHIYALQGVEIGGRSLMLVGGFNNESMLPAVAAVAADGPAATSPQTPGTPFVCGNCPPGRPLKYLLFPSSDVHIALGRPFVMVADIQTPDAAGAVEVSVRHPGRSMRAVYRVSRDLTPLSVAFSDDYWKVHQELSDAGKIKHRAEDCPERHNGINVRLWQPATGWTDVRVGPTFPTRLN